MKGSSWRRALVPGFGARVNDCWRILSHRRPEVRIAPHRKGMKLGDLRAPRVGIHDGFGFIGLLIYAVTIWLVLHLVPLYVGAGSLYRPTAGVPVDFAAVLSPEEVALLESGRSVPDPLAEGRISPVFDRILLVDPADPPSREAVASFCSSDEMTGSEPSYLVVVPTAETTFAEVLALIDRGRAARGCEVIVGRGIGGPGLLPRPQGQGEAAGRRGWSQPPSVPSRVQP